MYPPDCLIVKRPVPDVSKPCSDRKPWQAAARCSLSVVTGPSIMSSDPCSFSSFTRCVTKHLNLSLHLDFERHVIRAKVELTVEALEDRFATLVTLTKPGALPRYNCTLASKLTGLRLKLAIIYMKSGLNQRSGAFSKSEVLKLQPGL